MKKKRKPKRKKFPTDRELEFLLREAAAIDKGNRTKFKNRCARIVKFITIKAPPVVIVNEAAMILDAGIRLNFNPTLYPENVQKALAKAFKLKHRSTK